MTDDIKRYRALLESVAAGPNADVMSQYLSVSTTSAFNSTVIVLNIPVNQKITTDDGAEVEVYDVETAARFHHRSDGEVGPFYDTIMVNCNIEVPDADDPQDDDDVREYSEKIEEWMAQNYGKYLKQILINVGFSPAAANSIELDAVYTDMLEYNSEAIGRELLQVATKMLDVDIHTALKKYGVPILAVYTDYTADDLNDYKTDIVRYLLQVYKNRGATYQLTQILDNLDDEGVVWPELTAIRRSIRAS